MNALISTVNPVTMTSREIAELTGKAHFNVLVDVRKMLSELGEDELKFQDIYPSRARTGSAWGVCGVVGLHLCQHGSRAPAASHSGQ